MKQIGYIKTIHPEYVDFYFDVEKNYNFQYNVKFLNKLSETDLSNETQKRIQTMLNNIFSIEAKYQNTSIHYNSLTSEDKAARFYMLCCLAYPFFRDTVDFLGRQFRLNEHVATVQVMTHMKKLYGDRRRVEIAVSSILSSLYYWKLINRPKVGIYSAKHYVIDFSIHYTIMIEVLMLANNHNAITRDTLEHSSIFFPFGYEVSLSILSHNSYRIIQSVSDVIITK